MRRETRFGTQALRRFLADETGTTAIEYGLIAGLVAVTAIAAFITTGNALTNLFGYVSDTAVPVLNGG